MANEEITISELELADEVLADMVLAVDTTTDTKAVTLSQIKAWLGSSLPTGFILPAVGKMSDERFTLLDGKTLARTGTYEAFCNKVIEQVQAGNWFSCTETEFNQDVATYGQCGRFVITNDYVRIPLITRYIGATVTLSEIGRTYAESLPNITGKLNTESGAVGPVVGVMNSDSGAFYRGNSHSYGVQSRSITGYDLSFDASRSSSTYQDNAKVNPEHTKFPYYMVVSTNGQTEEIEVDINEVYEDLNLKANTTLSNVANVSSTFKEASVGWVMPSDDYVEYDCINYGQTDFTAPFDGIACARCENSENAQAVIDLWSKDSLGHTLIEQKSDTYTGGQGGACWIPCRKNQDVSVYIARYSGTRKLRFIKMKGNE